MGCGAVDAAIDEIVHAPGGIADHFQQHLRIEHAVGTGLQHRLRRFQRLLRPHLIISQMERDDEPVRPAVGVVEGLAACIGPVGDAIHRDHPQAFPDRLTGHYSREPGGRSRPVLRWHGIP